jgi:hypothetical protein
VIWKPNEALSPIPERLRVIATHIDMLERVALAALDTAALDTDVDLGLDDDDVAVIRTALSGDDMQHDLRYWADAIEIRKAVRT